MASQFYKRYVPPTKEMPQKDATDERASKRRRLGGEQEVQPDSVSQMSEKKTSKREKKSKRSKQDHESTTQPLDLDQTSPRPDPETLESDRHKKLRRKVEKATLASEHQQNSDATNGVGEPDSDAADDNEHDELPAGISEAGLVPLPQPAMVEKPTQSTLDALPRWLQEPTRVPVSSKRPLSELLPDFMAEGLLKNGYENATPIQQGLLPMLMPGDGQYAGDVCIASSTGTGKTLAFIAPMVEALRHRPVRRLRGLVIVPTREIVSQTQTLTNLCASKTGLQVSTATGIKTISEERKLLVRKTARYDKPQWDKTSGAKFDPVQYETSEDDTSDREYRFMQAFEGYVPEYRSKADILICTPGRLVEHLKTTKGFTLHHVEWLIVDEMDRLLNQSFQDWAEAVLPALEHNPRELSIEDAVKAGLTYLRRPRRVRKVLASATVTFDPDKLAAMHLWQPKLVSLQVEEASTKKSQYQIPPTLNEVAVAIQDVADKPLMLLRLLESISTHSSQPNAHNSDTTSARSSQFDEEMDVSDEGTSSSGSSTESTSSSDSSEDDDESEPRATHNPRQQGVLVFTSKNENAMRLSRLLDILNPKLRVGAFTGSSKSSERRKALAAFKRGDLRILVSSNLASRSLNLSGLEHVINYDIPTSVEMYVHRVGRTARAGKAGTATTLLAYHEARWFWNEIARSDVIERQHNIDRSQAPSISEADRERYEEALEQLGEEAEGQ